MKPATRALIDDSVPGVNRRSFFKTLGLGASAAMAMTGESAAAARANFIQSNVNRASEPSALRITDLRVAVVTGAVALHRGARSNMERLVGGTPFRRVAGPSSWREGRHAFIYWFSDPHRREGVNLNYRACRDSAVVHVHPSGFVVFDCRRIREPPLITTSSTSRAMQGLN